MLRDLLQEATELHQRQFKVRPHWIASAPGRVNLIGDHTDYTDGLAMPFAIDRYTVVTASPLPGSQLEVFSSFNNERVPLSLGKPDPERVPAQWHDYVRGVLSLMHQSVHAIPGLALCVHGNLPIGSGLSSSASLELAVATLLEGVSGSSLAALDKVLLCQRAEHDYANMPCGILDQFTVSEAKEGHLLLLDCRAHSARPIPIKAADTGFMVIDSQIRHQHSGGDYAQRSQECQQIQALLGGSLRDASREAVSTLEDSVLRHRATHVVTENARVTATAEALAKGDYAEVGKLMHRSHVSLKDDYSASCPEVDQLVEIARQTEGVFGARMTGGGFGGAVIAMVLPQQAVAAGAHIQQRYEQESGLATQPLIVSAVGGAALHPLGSLAPKNDV